MKLPSGIVVPVTFGIIWPGLDRALLADRRVIRGASVTHGSQTGFVSTPPDEPWSHSEMVQALVHYVRSLRDYCQAYCRLRRLTMFDFVTGQPIR